jgi:hypothetical protein
MGLQDNQDNEVVDVAEKLEVGWNVLAPGRVHSHVFGDIKDWRATIHGIDLNEKPQISPYRRRQAHLAGA